MLCFKYAPKSLADVAGNEEAKAIISNWAIDWERGKVQKPLLLWGPPGVGKTAIAKSLAAEHGWVLVESGASEARGKDAVQQIVGLGSSTGTLFGSRRLIVFDEVDAAFDRGEIPALAAAIKGAQQPIIIIANDYWEQKLAPLRLLCKPIELKRVNWMTVQKTIAAIANKEGIECDIAAISRNASGDLRAAINDVESRAPSARDRTESMFEVVRNIFKAKTLSEAVRAGDAADELDMVILWLDENIPAEYAANDGDIARAVDWLARSAVFQARIMKRQNWRLLKFVRALALGGVALAKAQENRSFTMYKFPSFLRNMGASKISRGMSKAVGKKIAVKTHTSTRTAVTEQAPLLAHCTGFAEYFELTEEEAAFAKERYA